MKPTAYATRYTFDDGPDVPVAQRTQHYVRTFSDKHGQRSLLAGPMQIGCPSGYRKSRHLRDAIEILTFDLFVPKAATR